MNPHEPEVDELLRAHFAQQSPDAQETPPAFRTLWDKAQAEVEQQTIVAPSTINSWYAPAIAALVLIACGALLTPEFLGRQQTDAALSEAATVKLFNELSRSTQWQAPSDLLLASVPELNVWGMPRLEWQQQQSMELSL